MLSLFLFCDVILRYEGSYPFSTRFFAGAQNDNNKTKYFVILRNEGSFGSIQIFVILRNEGSYPFSSRYFAGAQNDYSKTKYLSS